jgi:hypothetical protein
MKYTFGEGKLQPRPFDRALGRLLKGKYCLERRKEAGGIKVTFVNFFAERIGDKEAKRRRVGAGRR